MRRGLNVIEVGLVLVILGTLLALLFPAVQNVRGAASRTTCRNNLRQHGMAIDSYHDLHGHFPPGTLPNAALPPEERLSFHVAVVPFVEASPLYETIAKGEAWDSPANAAALAFYQARIYQCPAWARGRDDPPTLPGHLAVTNYVGVAGAGAGAAARPAEAPGIGIFGYDRTLKKADVKDGLENTALVFETGRDVGPWIRGGTSTVRAVEGDEGAFGGTHFRTRWTFQNRTDGFHVLLADGSVRFTAEHVAPAVLAALATAAGGEAIPADW